MSAGRRAPSLHGLSRLFAACAIVAVSICGAEAQTVLTGTQATYSLTVALVGGTPIEVTNVPPDGRELSLLRDYIARRMDRPVADVCRCGGRRFRDERLARRSALPFRARGQHTDREYRCGDPVATKLAGCRAHGVPRFDRRVGSRHGPGRDGDCAVFLAQRFQRDPHGRPDCSRSRRDLPWLGRARLRRTSTTSSAISWRCVTTTRTA